MGQVPEVDAEGSREGRMNRRQKQERCIYASEYSFSKSGIQTQVPSVDGVPIIATPSNRMYSAIKINDGKTSGQESGGYVKGETAKNLNFFICPMSTPIAVTKQDIMRIFDPATNQRMNAWQMDYRRFHDIWVLDNKLDSIYLSIQEAE
jgi:hypothetical protein